MPILPRPRRHTWLLALSVWLAACAGLWWAAPVVPTKTFAFNPAALNFAFHPDERNIVTVNVENKPVSESPKGHIHIWDIESGQQVGDRVRLLKNALAWKPSRNPRWWSESDMSESHVQILDTVNWQIENLIDVSPYAAAFSSDGHFLLIDSRVDGRTELIVWDLAERRIRAKLPDACWPADAVRDAGVVVAVIPPVSDGSDALHVFDLDSGRRLRSLPLNELNIPARVRLASDGSYAAASYYSVDSQQAFGRPPLRCPLRCWDVAAGKLCDLAPRINAQSFGFAEDRLIAGSSNAAEQTVECYSPQSGRLLWSRNLGPSIEPIMFDVHGISNDGRFIAIGRRRDGTNSWTDWLIRKGFLSKPLWEPERFEEIVLDTSTGRIVCSFPGAAVRWSPHSHQIMAVPRYGEFGIWDIPPRKSLPWLLTSATLLALPIAFVAWRRSKR